MRTHIIVFIVIILIAGCNGGQLPEPKIYSSLVNATTAAGGLFPGEWAIIGVDVNGDTRTGSGVSAKVDLVFLVDESGSMLESDSDKIRHSTIKNILNDLSATQHRAAIVVFKNNAEILGGYSQLTTEFSQLANHLDDLPDPDPEWLTNIAGAMQLANSLLMNSSANHRVAILLTDGYPSSETSYGYDLGQDAEINTTHVPNAITNDINYYVVHLVADDWVEEGTTLLQDRIAGDTGGEYFVAANAGQLTTQLPSIVDEVSTTLTLKDVVLDVHFNMGPTEYSAIDNENIFLAGANTFQVSAENVISESRATLPDNQAVTIKIPITSYTPIPPGSPPELSEVTIPSLKPSAQISYHLGDNVLITKTIPQVMVKWLRAPEVLVLKRLDPALKRVTISVTNFIREGAITDVNLWEILALNFEPIYPSLSPNPRYMIPIYYNQRDLAYLYWELGSIEPLQTESVSFDVRYHGPNGGIVEVDSRKPASEVRYTDPDGASHVITTGTSDLDSSWYGNNQIDAAILNVFPEVSVGPDLIIFADHNGGRPGADMSITPVPTSYSLWNDSFDDNGYDEEAEYSYFANPEPLDLSGKNKIWIRIDNVGNQTTSAEINVNVYINARYCACHSDLDLSFWQSLGSVDFGTNPLAAGAHLVESLVVNIPEQLSASMISDLATSGNAFVKGVITYTGSELRLNNNTAVTMISIAP